MKPESIPKEASVLSRAALRAAERLGMSGKELGRVLGVSDASISRLGRFRAIAPESKEGELAILFVRLYRSLDSLVGGDDEASRAWLRAENHHLGSVPAELIQRVEGLVRTVEYLDALRGKV